MILTIVFFLAITINLGTCVKNDSSSASMKCYVCTNIDDPDCADEPRSDKFIMDCDAYFASKSQTFSPQAKDYFCRKTIEQGLTFQGENNTVRIIRSCGNIRNQDRSCYKTSDAQVKTETCECFSELCNGANTRTSSSTLFLTVLIPSVTMIFIANL